MHPVSRNWTRRGAAFGIAAALTRVHAAASEPPAIEFTRIPQADEGGRQKHDIIAGRVKGARAGHQIVLYSKSGAWWVQPLPNRSFTRIEPNGTWVTATHLGSEYAALLVDRSYHPERTLNTLPPVGGAVAAVLRARGSATSPSPSIHFSGYEWRVRNAPSSRGGQHPYDPANVSVDASGALHLRVARAAQAWSCAEVSIVRSLGYGTYSFAVRDVAHFEPAIVFGMFTWDYAGADENYHEFATEVSRWGAPGSKNAQYVIQPYYVPANVERFQAPAGPMTFQIQWEPGRVAFRTVRGATARGSPVAEHLFTSGVPAPGIESMRMNLYEFTESPVKLAKDAEVVIDRFEFLP